MDIMDKTRLKVINDFKANHPFSFECIKDMGRVEGAKTELQNCIKDLEASLEFYECDYGKFEQQVVDKVIEELTENINKFKKRLKELEKGGKE